MITLINPPSLKNFSGIQPAMTANPPLGLAYVAAALKEAGFDFHIIDGTGDVLPGIAFKRGGGVVSNGLGAREGSGNMALGVSMVVSGAQNLRQRILNRNPLWMPDPQTYGQKLISTFPETHSSDIIGLGLRKYLGCVD